MHLVPLYPDTLRCADFIAMSAIERADKNGVITNQLMVDHPGFGVPSAWLPKSPAKGRELAIPRLMVVSHEMKTVARVGTSCRSLGHEEITLEHDSSLLEDLGFMHPTTSTREQS